MRFSICLIAFFYSFMVMAQSPEVDITTKNNSKYEIGVAKRMNDILKQYDLSKWIFTKKIIVEDGVIPHSHPVLTLNTKKRSDNDLLSTFIHEQLHWYVDANPDAEKKAVTVFRKRYKNVPIRNGKGARDEYSTYMHLIVCYLEYRSMAELLDEETAKKLMKASNHYTWIYETVIQDQAYIGGILAKYKLNLVD